MPLALSKTNSSKGRPEFCQHYGLNPHERARAALINNCRINRRKNVRKTPTSIFSSHIFGGNFKDKLKFEVQN